MVEIMKEETPYWWWFDSHEHSSRRSPWLQSTLGELDRKTKVMLKLIEEDADSFAQRAEMYYKKRPELISKVEDFYRTHRSLAERYDQLKSESANRLLTTLGSPFSTKYQQQKLTGVMDQTYDMHSETYETEDSAESEVDDPELEDEIQFNNEMGEVDDPEQEDETRIDSRTGEVEEPKHKKETRVVEVVGAVSNNEVKKLQEEIERLKEENRIQKDQLMQKDKEKRDDHFIGTVCNNGTKKLQEEIERLKEENRNQKDQLMQKDEEKREVIRQLSLAVEVLKLENVNLRKSAPRGPLKKKSLFEFEKLKDYFQVKLFNGSSRSRSIVELSKYTQHAN